MIPQLLQSLLEMRQKQWLVLESHSSCESQSHMWVEQTLCTSGLRTQHDRWDLTALVKPCHMCRVPHIWDCDCAQWDTQWCMCRKYLNNAVSCGTRCQRKDVREDQASGTRALGMQHNLQELSVGHIDSTHSCIFIFLHQYLDSTVFSLIDSIARVNREIRFQS